MLDAQLYHNKIFKHNSTKFQDLNKVQNQSYKNNI